MYCNNSRSSSSTSIIIISSIMVNDREAATVFRDEFTVV